MNFILEPWQLFFAILAGWVNQQQQESIDYLRTENAVLKELHGPTRILLNDDQRRRLSDRCVTQSANTSTIITPTNATIRDWRTRSSTAVRKSAGHRAKWNAESASVGCSAITCVGQHNAPVRGVARNFVRAARPDRRRASRFRIDHKFGYDVLDNPLRAGRVFAAPASLNSRKSSVIGAAQYFGLTGLGICSYVYYTLAASSILK
jgi:hypothetical protein